MNIWSQYYLKNQINLLSLTIPIYTNLDVNYENLYYYQDITYIQYILYWTEYIII